MADEIKNTKKTTTPPTEQGEGVTPSAREKGVGGDQMDNRGNLKGNPEGKQGKGSHPTDMGAPNPNPDHLHGQPSKGLTQEEQENQERDKNPPR